MTDTNTTSTAGAYDAMLTGMVGAIKVMADKANAIAEEASKSTGDSAKAIREFVETSDDEKIVAYREWLEGEKATIAKAKEAAHKHAADALGLSLGWTDEQIKSAKDEHAELKRNASKMIKSLLEICESFGIDKPELPTLLNFSGKASASSATGAKRPRFSDVEVNGASIRKDGKSTFSMVSQMIKSETGVSMGAGEIFDAFAKEVGTDNWEDFSHTTVTFTVTDKDEVVHEYEVTPYVDKADDESDTDDTDATDSE